jgi:hypothetical protein
MEKTVFTFGRLNPPTVGHEKLVDKVKQVAKRLNAEPHVFLSHSQNSKKDPLSYNQKFKYAKQAFGNVVIKSNARTVIQIMQELEKMNHKDVVMVVGSDRVQEFRVLLNKYNGKDFNFNSIKVVSAGDRDPDADGVSGMSASKMRAAASEGDAAAFLRGVPSKLSTRSAKTMYNDLRSAMNIREDFDNFDWEHWAETVDIEDIEILDEAVLSYAQRIKRARTMKRLAPRMKNLRRIKKFKMADKDRLMKRARKQAISLFRKKMAGDRGEHYAQQSTSAKISIDKLVQTKMKAVHKLAQRLLPKVRKAEMERLRKARQHSESYQIESNGQTDDVADIVPDRIRISMISGSRKKMLNDKFEKLGEQEIAARVSGPSTNQTDKRHSGEVQRMKDRHKQERERLKTRHDGQKNRAQIRDIRSESLNHNFEQMIEGLKDPKDNPCWDGYKPVGTKKKKGKTVPNCVPEGGADKDLASNVKSKSVYEAKKIPHALDPKKSLKHAMTDIGLDRDSDGDVDILDKMKKLNPDEITGTEKNTKAIQSFRKKRAEIEKKHTRVGVAYEEKSEGGAGKEGTDQLTRKYKKDTPGE